MENEQQTTARETAATPEAVHTTAPASTTATPTEDNALLMGILCYLGILVIIPYLMAKDNAHVKFHLKQGIVLVVIELILYALGMMVLVPILWPIISLLNLGCLVLSIIGIINVVQKKEVALPLVGGFAEKVKI